MTLRAAARAQRQDEIKDSEGDEADSRCRYYGQCPDREERCGVEGPRWYSPEEEHVVLCARRAGG